MTEKEIEIEEKRAIDFIINSYVNEKKSLKTITEITKLPLCLINLILKENNVELRKGTTPERSKTHPVPTGYRLPDNYVESEINKYKAVCKQTGEEFKDYMDKGGMITKHIFKLYGVKKPNLTKRKSYYLEHGKYWHEQYFDIIQYEKEETKKCKFCNWETVDINNLSGYYKIHLQKEHNIEINDYLKKYPEELEYFKKEKRKIDFESNPDNYVTCLICGEKKKRIGTSHLKQHGITKLEYQQLYSKETLAKNTKDVFIECAMKGNLALHGKGRKETREEKIISDLLTEHNIEFIRNDRKTMGDGKEIDFLIESHKLGIEFNGNQHHTQWFGKKDKNYHLNKTLNMNKAGYNLIHIFDDEIHYKTDIVLGKIRRALNIKEDLIVVGARKCEIKEISTNERRIFLDKNHIQGNGDGKINLGAYFEGKLIGVMVFKKTSGIFELVRFATDNDYSTPGLGSKLLKYFINSYTKSGDKIISFADRRWTLDKDNNLYTKLGFDLVGASRPEYRYYNCKVDRYMRFHKFNFRKQKLNKKYGLSLDLTETEMVKELGYDRIWDCGLFKYELKIK